MLTAFIGIWLMLLSIKGIGGAIGWYGGVFLIGMSVGLGLAKMAR